jgi:hypothetical protein
VEILSTPEAVDKMMETAGSFDDYEIQMIIFEDNKE